MVIGIYQKYISPHKGFCCAYKVHHNESSCSEFAKNMVREKGVFKAIPSINERFGLCKISSDYLKNEYEIGNDKKAHKAGKCSLDACNAGACFYGFFSS
jgi:putative component of membrane protein insertase Oxa1/YidC/SpoIIIJ protein YidD